MLKNLKLGNLIVTNQDHTDLSKTDPFIREISLIARYHVEGIQNRLQQGSVKKEGVALVRLNPEHSLVIYINPKLKNNPYFMDYESFSGEVHSDMNYENFKSLKKYDKLAYFEIRMDRVHVLDMSPLLKPGTLEKIRDLAEEWDARDEEYEIDF